MYSVFHIICHILYSWSRSYSYHVMGQKFSTTDEVKQKVSSLHERWSIKLVPAICELAKETTKASPPSDLPDGKHACTIC